VQVRWTVLVPAKSLPGAKSRLAAGIPDADAHARLVHAIRADTLAAARTAPSVARVIVITDRAEAGHHLAADAVLVQTRPGLNAALEEAAAYASAQWPQDGVAALVGDLPALRANELAAALDWAAARPRAYVVDVHGVGTTLLTARPGAALQPAFGGGSAARHDAGADRLAAGPGLRQDVDTDTDLWQALELGVGPATLTAVASRSFRVQLRRA
jgi:2-phospho-L-lactate guanylyltransferase